MNNLKKNSFISSKIPKDYNNHKINPEEFNREFRILWLRFQTYFPRDFIDIYGDIDEHFYRFWKAEFLTNNIGEFGVRFISGNIHKLKTNGFAPLLSDVIRLYSENHERHFNE